MRGRTAVQRIIQNADIEITLQNIVNAVEDELLLIDKDYRVRFANSTALPKTRGLYPLAFRET